MSKRLWLLTILNLGLAPAQLTAQGLDLNAKQNFIEVVDPLITRGERDIYERLPDSDARTYFQAIFWHKRDPDPGTTGNAFRRAFFERRQIAQIQFGEQGTSGDQTDRGRIFLLLGEPTKVTQNRLAVASAIPGYEELWDYEPANLRFRFVFTGREAGYSLEKRDDWEARLEAIRESQVLDRAEPYVLRPLPLALPNLGFTKDIENLAAQDRHDIKFRVTYAPFQGDLHRTELFVGLTFFDASDKGLDLQLAAYDPYGHKVVDYKRKLQVTNGRLEGFTVVLEPDQYNLILRLRDRDGREAISRRLFDLPRIRSTERSASGLLVSSGLRPVPLQGFQHPKKFVFENRYFPIENAFQGFDGDRLYFMQHFYNVKQLPELDFYWDDQKVQARVENELREAGVIRAVFSIAVPGQRVGSHSARSVFIGDSGDSVTTQAQIHFGDVELEPETLLNRAQPSDAFQIQHPASADIVTLDRVVVRANPDLAIRSMYLFLNGNMIYERSRAPWEIRVDPEIFSISGENTLTVVLDTDRGLLKVEKKFNPFRADEKVQTRVVEIFFNAFDAELNFLTDFDKNRLAVKVDGKETTPLDLRRQDEPLTYCFLVDNSYSMRESFANNISAVKRFIESIRPRDRAYFITFSDHYTQILMPTTSKAVLLAVADSIKIEAPNPAFGDRLYEENRTFLYDASIAAIHSMLQYPGHKAILLVSDGISNEGEYKPHGMLSYARENDVVLYSLWIDNNPKISEAEEDFLRKERSKGEKFLRAIGLSRVFRSKDSRANILGDKIRQDSITQGTLKILAEESGGFHYRIFRADRSLIMDYVRDIENAISSQFVMTLELPVSVEQRHVEITSQEEGVDIRCKSEVRVRKTNPLVD